MKEYKWVDGDWVEMSKEEIDEERKKYNIATRPRISYLRFEPDEALDLFRETK
jgi:hypothetical protein